MALTRKMLEGMNLEEKQIDSIIEAHMDTVNGIKADRDKFKELAAEVPDLKRQIEDSKAASASNGEWKDKYDKLSSEFDAYKTQIADEKADAEKAKADAEKAKAYQAMLINVGIDPRRVDRIMKISDLSDVVLEDGKIKDIEKLEQAAKDEWSDFIVQKKTVGSEPATPPDTTHGNEGADPSIRKMLQERHDRLYGKVETKED